MRLTDDQQRRILRHIESVRSIRRMFAWMLFLISTIGLTAYINVSLLPSITNSWQAVLFELGVIAVVSVVNLLCLGINYELNGIAAIITLAAVVMSAAVIAEALLISPVLAGLLAVVFFFAAVAISGVLADDEDLIERD